MGKEVVGKNNSEKEVLVADGPRWSFLRQALPDFLKDPWEEVARFVNNFPFPDELKLRILELIKAKRGDQDEANPDVAS